MPRNQKKLDPAIFIVIGIVIILAAVTIAILLNVETDEFTQRSQENPQVPLLFLISDEDAGLVTIQLILMDTNTGSLAIYDIPGKLGTIIPALGRVDRLDNLYAELGAGAVVKTLEGIFDIPMNFYFDLGLRDIQVLVDSIDGVAVFLPVPIEDRVNGEILRIPGGNVLLDGEKIASFIAYQGDQERELEWISRRWSFVREFLRSVSEYSLLYSSKDLFDRFYRHLNSSFEKPAVLSLIEGLGSLDYDDMLTQRVLGNERIVETSLGEQSILFPHFEGQLVRDSVVQVLRSLGAQEAAYTAALSSKIEILNGTTINGLASKTQDLYENFGFEVLRIGNADRNDYERTIIIDRSGNPDLAVKIGSLIRTDNIAEGSPSADNPDVDVSIVLGSDFDGWYVNSSDNTE